MKIATENILVDHEHNFNKLTENDVNSLDEPYDYNSIMHYARNTYSKNAEYKDTILTILTKPMTKKKIFPEIDQRRRMGHNSNAPEIGQRKGLSQSDIIQTNKLYSCPVCGKTFQEPSATISSSDFPSIIKDRKLCEWRIASTLGERILLNITELNIFKSKDCSIDYLEIRDGYWHRSNSFGRFCGENEFIPPILSTGNRLLLTYVSTKAEMFGFKAKYESICGGDLSIESVTSIESPNHPLFYPPNKNCVWRINVPHSYQVALEFNSFDLDFQQNCLNDYLEVRDGSNESFRLIGIYCGNSIPPILASTTNSMFIKFISDGSGENFGFSATLFREMDECKLKNHGCEQECINTLESYRCACRFGYQLRADGKTCETACGGIIETSNGIITSPGYPFPYPADETCIWEIIAEKRYRITLDFTFFELEGSHLLQEDCDYDSVTISSKYEDDRLQKEGVFCSERLPPSITSETNVMRVKFQSDSSVQKTGFSAKFSSHLDSCGNNNGGCSHICRNTLTSIECKCKNGYILHENGKDCIPGACLFEITATHGIIKSQNHPNNYSKNLDCIWHFIAMPGHRVFVEFVEFNTEFDSECSNDYVAIYINVDSSSRIKSNYLIGDTYTLGKFCGNDLPNPITSPPFGMYMMFKTDDSVQKSGFVAYHSTVCGGHFFATDKEIKYIYSHSKYGDTNYENNTDCDWIIRVQQPWQRILLTFHTFDLEEEQACSFDFVDLYDGIDDQSGIMYGRFCGKEIPLKTISMRRSLLLRFRSDEEIQKKGFLVSYTVANATVIEEFERNSPKYNRIRIA